MRSVYSGSVDPPVPTERAPLSAEQREHLRALGQSGRKHPIGYNAGQLRMDGAILRFKDVALEQLGLLVKRASPDDKARILEQIDVDWPDGTVDPHFEQRPASYTKLSDAALQHKVQALEEIRIADRFGVYTAAGGRPDAPSPLRIAGVMQNIGEEKVLVGSRGTGTIYFSGCSMRCGFCHYWDAARQKRGQDISPQQLASLFLQIQKKGAHSVQLMTPTHLVGPIVEAVRLAKQEGLVLPLVYNTGGYEDHDALRALEGVIDIYLPDAKFGSDEAGARYGGIVHQRAPKDPRFRYAQGYFENLKTTLRIMHEQVGDLQLDARGVATRGMLIRHLIMPGQVAQPRAIAALLRSISKDSYVNVMPQWSPEGMTSTTPEVHRKTSAQEIEETFAIFREVGLQRVVGQDREEVSLGTASAASS